MKKTILYVVAAAAITAMTAIAVVGCNGDLGSGNNKMDEFLVKFRGTADTTTPKFVVRFNANGGSGSVPKEETVRAGSEIKLPDQGRLTMTGYNFSGWNTDQFGNGDSYNAGAPYTPKSNSTLYAQWTNAPVSVVTVSSTGIGASGGGSYTDGQTVTIKAGTAPDGQQFINWTTTTSGVTFASPNSPTTTFIMPPRAVTVTANFGAVAEGKYAVTVSSVGAGASGGGSYASGATVTINAGADPFGHRFKNWTTESGSGVIFVDANSRKTTFVMPGNAATVTANFYEVPTYKVTIESEGTNASKDSSYREGDTVTINAGTAPTGKRFNEWTSASNGVTFANAGDVVTTFIMPANAVAVTANFQANTYTVTISAGTGATGGGEYYPGSTVTITAGIVQDGLFKNWTSSNSNVVFADANNATTTFIMPSVAVTVTARFVSGVFTDSRDGQIYGIVTIGGKTWMAENLNYPTSSGSWCYDDSTANCEMYGRLYDYSTANTVCPSGWHLPSRQEWGDLAKAAGGTGDYGEGNGTADTKLKSTNGWERNGTDDFGFSALPGGFRYSYSTFRYIGNDGNWWTATEYGNGNGNVYIRYISRSFYDTVGEDTHDMGYAHSVRCVKND